MTRTKLLSALDIAEELNTGKATIKYILKRFNKWLPCELVNGMPVYKLENIKTIIQIIEHLDAGMLPIEIDEYFATFSNPDKNQVLEKSINPLLNQEIRLNKEGVMLLKSFFGDLNEQQKRIAIAHEKRAAAEERKAIAIEKRAEAEEKKAEAMNNIANALQEMNKFRSGGEGAVVPEIAHQAAKTLIMDETDPFYTGLRQNNIHNGKTQPSEIFDDMESELSGLLNEDGLIEKISTINEYKSSFDTETEDPLSCLTDIFKTDDLSLPIKNGHNAEINLIAQLDDLSALLEDSLQSSDIDDLSALIDKKPLESFTTEDLDDLSLLIDFSDKIKNISQETISKKPNDSLDNLSRLIIENDDGMDDLSMLIDTSTEKKIQLDISPDDGIEKYKTAIMKIILELKTDGYSAEETTFLLNKNKIRTLSGKPEWSQKAISQIYKFMTSIK